jgi:NAD(P)-dependent dehydrogenase (short-subunit alcohol dehydrogenase family)
MHNPFSLEGKTILVTGASSGIGKSIAIECSKMGAILVITGRNKERLKETFFSLSGEKHMQILADLSTSEGIIELVEQCPQLNGCVNNAGIAKLVPIQFIKRENVDEIFGANTFAPILLTSLLVKKKKIESDSSIVFTSAISGVYMSSFGESLYSASKGAIHGFVKGIALDLAHKRIRVNTVNPGLVPTSILDVASDFFSKEEVLERRIVQYPLKRFGKPEDIAYGVIYLLSDASSWITGSSLLIDGGLTLCGI